jgi:hypothetical protein
LDERQFVAWRYTSDGLSRNSEMMVWEGNRLLLLYEQAFVLDEAAYAPYPWLGQTLSTSLLFGLFGRLRSIIPLGSAS